MPTTTATTAPRRRDTGATDAEIARQIQMGPSSGGVSARPPIGVPEGYMGGRQPTVGYGDTLPENPEGQGLRAPRYFEGDELLPSSLNPSDVARIQRDLADAGLLRGRFRLGYWDAPSQAAYGRALAYANQSGMSVKSAIGQLKTHPEQGTDEQRAPLVVKTTSPDDLRATFRDVSRKLLGRQLSEPELNSYVQTYNQVEAQRQRQAYDIEETGGAVEAIPDPLAYISERIRSTRPTEVKTYEIGSRAKEFFDLLGPFGDL